MAKFDRSKLFVKKTNACVTLDSDTEEFNGSKGCGIVKTGRFKSVLASNNSDNKSKGTNKTVSSLGNSSFKKKSTYQC